MRIVVTGFEVVKFCFYVIVVATVTEGVPVGNAKIKSPCRVVISLYHALHNLSTETIKKNPVPRNHPRDGC